MIFFKYDTKGDVFDFPAYTLDTVEYAKIVSEINTNYARYKDTAFAVHYSLGVDNLFYVYYFENHGFNDYNIVGKFEA